MMNSWISGLFIQGRKSFTFPLNETKDALGISKVDFLKKFKDLAAFLILINFISWKR